MVRARVVSFSAHVCAREFTLNARGSPPRKENFMRGKTQEETSRILSSFLSLDIVRVLPIAPPTMSNAPTHILFECATGAALFECVQTEEIGNKTKQVQEAINDLNSFGRMVKLVSFSPFKNALDALQSCLDVSEGKLTFLTYST